MPESFVFWARRVPNPIGLLIPRRHGGSRHVFGLISRPSTTLGASYFLSRPQGEKAKPNFSSPVLGVLGLQTVVFRRRFPSFASYFKKVKSMTFGLIFFLFSPSFPHHPTAPNQQVLTKPVADGKLSKDGKDKEIPIPEIRKVQSYEQDYRANFSRPVTYLRSEYTPLPPPPPPHHFVLVQSFGVLHPPL